VTPCQPTAKELDTVDTALVKVRLPTSSLQQRFALTNLLAKKHLQKTFGFHGQAEAVNGDQDRRDSNSSDYSDGGHAQSDGECGTKDSTRSNRRKRARKSPSEPTSILEGLQRESLVSNPVATTRLSLMIADENAVMAFYRRILADGQQTLCKKLAKWWIRAINPNKQTNYPYAKGPEKKPPWWPQTPPNNAVGVPTKGTTENGFVRHKEPDHLAKPGNDPLQFSCIFGSC
jgi:hypothetical protein